MPRSRANDQSMRLAMVVRPWPAKTMEPRLNMTRQVACGGSVGWLWSWVLTPARDLVAWSYTARTGPVAAVMTVGRSLAQKRKMTRKIHAVDEPKMMEVIMTLGALRDGWGISSIMWLTLMLSG